MLNSVKKEAALDLPDNTKDSKRTGLILAIQFQELQKKKNANLFKSLSTAFVPAFKMLPNYKVPFIPAECHGASEWSSYT